MNDPEASRRVLDMLAGWTHYLDTSISEAGDSSRTEAQQAALNEELDAVAELYQKFGREANNEDVAYINSFIYNEVLPVILTGK